MDSTMSKSLCQTLLKAGLITEKTVQTRDRFQLISDDLLNCFKSNINEKKIKLDGLKKIIGRILSAKAKQLNVSDQIVKQIKILLYNKINRIKKLKKMKKIKVQEETDEIKMQESSDMFSSENSQKFGISQFQTGQYHVKKFKTRKITKKYRTFDSDFKEKVCQTATKNGIQYAINKFKFSKRKITSWLEAYNLNLLGKGRKALDPAMQFNMSVWILKKIWNQIPLTQKVIREKASTMSTLKIQFNGSKGWLQKFFLRHVQLKSCFDTRGRPSSKQECIRYHRSAYFRLLKDYSNMLKLQMDQDLLVDGNLQQIIYGKESHPLLKLDQDKNLDKHRIEKADFYDYQKIKNVPAFGLKLEDISQENQQQQVNYKKQQEQAQEQEQEELESQQQQLQQQLYSGQYDQDSSQNESQLYQQQSQYKKQTKNKRKVKVKKNQQDQSDQEEKQLKIYDDEDEDQSQDHQSGDKQQPEIKQQQSII